MKEIKAYIYIDALGWKTASDFMADVFSYRRGVKSQLGYSAAALSAVLSGEAPARHGVFCDFYLDRKNSPFKRFKYLKYFFGAGMHPACLFNRKPVREAISKASARLCKYSGRLNLYRVPYDYLQYFDTVQKRDVASLGGLFPVENLRDVLENSGVSFYMSDWRKSQGEDLSLAVDSISKGAEFLFVCVRGLGDFLMCNADNKAAVDGRLKACREDILKILNALRSSGRPYKLTVMSGLGMLPCSGSVDLKKAVDGLNLKYGSDYIAFYDSTMARFWYMNSSAKERIRAELSTLKYSGGFISGEQKNEYGILFEDGRFGEDIFLLNGGFQIAPSYISVKPFKASCGYSPDIEGTRASFLSTRNPEFEPESVSDFFMLMKSDIGAASEIA